MRVLGVLLEMNGATEKEFRPVLREFIAATSKINRCSMVSLLMDCLSSFSKVLTTMKRKIGQMQLGTTVR